MQIEWVSSTLTRTFPDGTEHIIKHLGLDFIRNYSYGAQHIARSNAEQWLKDLSHVVRSFRDCDVLLVQFGADAHADDCGSLTSEQMKRRDEIVFEIAHEIGVPVAFCLGGGYRKPFQKVLDTHLLTIRAAIQHLNKRGGRNE